MRMQTLLTATLVSIISVALTLMLVANAVRLRDAALVNHFTANWLLQANEAKSQGDTSREKIALQMVVLGASEKDDLLGTKTFEWHFAAPFVWSITHGLLGSESSTNNAKKVLETQARTRLAR